MPFDPNEKLKATKVDLDELGLHLNQLHFDDENNILVVNMDLDEDGDPMYDIDTYIRIIDTIGKNIPSKVTVVGLLPGIMSGLYTKEEMQNYVNTLQKLIDTLD